jgi:hypothetical protein
MTAYQKWEKKGKGEGVKGKRKTYGNLFSPEGARCNSLWQRHRNLVVINQAKP